MISLRQMRLNIWAAIQLATHAEIHEGMHFYYGAHGLCRMFAAITRHHTPSQVAGIYAALSPMNGWETNVANTLTVLKWSARDKSKDCKCEEPWPGLSDYGAVICERCGSQYSIHTPKINQEKALAIADGANPLSVLRGRKVRAFYTAIANPHDTSPIPVDRHLICLALGGKLSKNELSRAASDRELYSRVESVYADLGKREGVGNRLASIAWFVQRRIQHSRQLTLAFDPTSPVCCGRLMHSHGTSPRRFACGVCGRTRTSALPRIDQLDRATLDDDIRALISRNRYRVTVDPRGIPRIQLGVGHYAAASGGSQYLARFVTMHTTGGRLRSDEHVHHVNGNKLDCRRDNLEVWLSEHHGRHHARTQLLYMVRDKASGRFVASDVPGYDVQYSEQYASLEEVPF